MTTRDQRVRLLSPGEIDRVFDAGTIENLARVARIPRSADLEVFGNSVREALRQYLTSAAAPHPSEYRQEIQGLATAVRRALDGEPAALQTAADLLDGLSLETRDFLQNFGPTHRLPTSSDLRHPENGTWALKLLSGQLHQGSEPKPGRGRPGGKRSRPTLRSRLAYPPVKRGRPKNAEEIVLCAYLANAYSQATGKGVPRHTDPRKPGPFARLVSEVLNRIKHVANAVELVNAYGSQIRRS